MHKMNLQLVKIWPKCRSCMWTHQDILIASTVINIVNSSGAADLMLLINFSSASVSTLMKVEVLVGCTIVALTVSEEKHQE